MTMSSRIHPQEQRPMSQWMKKSKEQQDANEREETKEQLDNKAFARKVAETEDDNEQQDTTARAETNEPVDEEKDEEQQDAPHWLHTWHYLMKDTLKLCSMCFLI
jgi:hypothetical protein